MVLKPLSDAVRDDDQYLWTIVGIGSSSDGGEGQSPLRTTAAGQERALTGAQEFQRISRLRWG